MKIALPLTALLLLTACPNNQGQDTKLQSDNNQTKQATTAKTNNALFENGFNIDDYPIDIQEVSEKEYNQAINKLSTIPPKKQLNIIKDISTAKSKLGNMIKFDANNRIQAVYVNNGQVYQDMHAQFISYNVDENLLIINNNEDGHISIDLDTGNYVRASTSISQSSPNQVYRFNIIEIDDCAYPIIGKYVNGKWINNIELKLIFEQIINTNKNTYQSLCGYENGFFVDSNNAYIKTTDDSNKTTHQYYKIIIKSDREYQQLDLSGIPRKTLPQTIQVDFSNYKNLTQLNRNQAKFFSGLFPFVGEIYAFGTLDYSDNFTSLIVTFKEYDNTLNTLLIIIDKDGHIINYDERISFARTSQEEPNSVESQSIIDKEQVKKQAFIISDSDGVTTYKIDRKGYFVSGQ